MMHADTAIVWFRQDLRIADNPALRAGIARGRVVPVYIWSPEEEGDWPVGAAGRWWLHQSLGSLDEALRAAGSRLIIQSGDSLAALRQIIKITGASAVCWNRRYEPAARNRDEHVQQALTAEGIAAESFTGSLLFEPGTILTKAGEPYQVFTSFWKACLAAAPGDLAPTPRRISAPRKWPASQSLDALELEPAIDWAGGMRAAWTPGCVAAPKMLRSFLKKAVAHYDSDRHRLDLDGTSRLSPHLHFGEISPRQVWYAAADLPKSRRAGADAFLSELGWREFAYHLLFHFPYTPEQPLREKFKRFEWRHNRAALQRWQKGVTGFPIVDAAMRQLWQTGWMPNRARMIVASFLTKDLLIPWQDGAEWFWDTLVDADLANNTLGWQWTAGCGADAAPFFRIFNPVGQAEKFDPEGDYIRRWVPEIAKLPAPWVFKPWEAPEGVLQSCGVQLGTTYPEPIVDHARARQAALAAFKQV